MTALLSFSSYGEDIAVGDAFTTASSPSVRIDTRTDETHPVSAGTIVELYGETPWTAPDEAKLYTLTHTDETGTWTARYEVAGGDVVVVGDADITSDTVWTADKTRIVTGSVLVKGGTLTIEPGATLLQGEGGGIRLAGGAIVSDGASFAPLGNANICGTSAVSAKLDTRTDETHPVAAGTVVEIYGEAPWTAPDEARLYTLTHTDETGTWTARYEVAGGDVVVVGDADITSDTVWTADKTWIVTGSVLVKGGTLTIEPGATVLQGVGGGIRLAGGAIIADGASFASLGNANICGTSATSAKLDTRTDDTHYVAAGTEVELYGEAPWTAPEEAKLYILSHTDEMGKWFARYRVVGDNVVVIGDDDITSDVTWTSNKTWIVTGTILVRSGTLTIEPDTTVLLDGNSGLRQAGGTVIADGVAFCNINFDGRMDYAEAEKGEVRLDTDVGGLRVAAKEEPLAFSTLWGESEAAQVKVSYSTAYDECAEVVSESGPAEGEYIWQAESPGYYTFTHAAGDETLMATFVVTDPETTETVFEGTISESTDWTKDKVILIDGIITVKSGATLTIEPGVVVKFMNGAGIVCEAGGRCIADGVIFTHVNDDTVGGDTLLDGSTSPMTDMYVLNGVSGNDATQYRYHPDLTVTLSGTIAQNEVWRGFNVYHVTGNLTVPNGVTLTIEPGAIIKFDPGLSLTVNSGATLNAIGTRAQPIVFTSIKDDEHGGDTNGDGKSDPESGDYWATIKAYGTLRFEYASILYGGNNGSSLSDVFFLDGGNVTFDNSVLAHVHQYGVGLESGSWTMRNSCFVDFFTAFRHFASCTCINSVFYDFTYLSNNGGQSFKNCVISRYATALCWWTDTCTYDNCIIFNPTGFGPQSSDKTGSNGNIWGDPKFLDPGKGDYRVATDSPCVDAADASVAPKMDYFGQPRINAPDIGICEVMPRNVTSDIDLVPQGVTADAEAVSGQMLTINWTVANQGGADANIEWRDTVSLVSESGRTVTLGEKVTTRRLIAGGTISCSASFIVPAVAEGSWYPKVNVNSHRDIFEGALQENNVLTGETAVNVSTTTLDLSVANEGVINAGTPMVLKLTFGEADDNRMVKFDVPVGVKVTWGFGFMPGGARSVASGSTVSTDSGVMFRVPDDATDVYVLLESDATTTYNLSTETTKMTITGVSPATLPSSGTTTLTITGAGFSPTNEIHFVNGGAIITPESMQYINSQCLIVSVDGEKFSANQSYALEIPGDYNTAQLNNALSVVGEKGEGHFWARLVVPDLARKGRETLCYVEYGNDGNADIPCQVMQISIAGDGELYRGNINERTRLLQIMAIGIDAAPGVIPSGFEQRVPFVLIAGNQNNIILSSSFGKDNHPPYFENAIVYLDALSCAVSRLALMGADMYSYDLALDEALKVLANPSQHSFFGKVVNAEGCPIQGIQIIAESMDVLSNSISDEKGLFRIEGLTNGLYTIHVNGSFTKDTSVNIVLNGRDVLINPFVLKMSHSLKINISGLENGVRPMVSISMLGRDEYSEPVWKSSDTVEFCNLSNGFYRVLIKSEDKIGHAIVRVTDDMTREISVPIEMGSQIKGIVEGVSEADTVGVAIVGEKHGFTTVIPVDESGSYLSDLIPPDDYMAFVVCADAEYEIATNIQTVTGETIVVNFNIAEQPNQQHRLWARQYNRFKLGDSYGFFEVMPWNLRKELFERYLEGRDFLELYAWPAYENQRDYVISYYCIHNEIHARRDYDAYSSFSDLLGQMYAMYVKTDEAYYSAVWRDLEKSAKDFASAIGQWWSGGRAEIFDKAIGAADTALELYIDDNLTLKSFLREHNFPETPNVFLGRLQGVVSKFSISILYDLDACIQWEEDITMAYDDFIKYKDLVEMAIGLAKLHHGDTSSVVGYLMGMSEPANVIEARMGALISLLKSHMNLLKAFRDSESAAKRLGADHQRIRELLGQFDKQFFFVKTVLMDMRTYHPPCPDDGGEYHPSDDEGNSDGVISRDPNEMSGPTGLGDSATERFVKPGEWMTYTVYFENVSNATAAAQEVYVANPLSKWLDWSTFEMGEIAFNNQIDLGLSGKNGGTCEATMKGTNFIVRTTLAVEANDDAGTRDACPYQAKWYLRIVDPTTDTGWPTDILVGFLPPNDETFRGEGHLTYRVKVRDDAPANVVITNSATIVFDYNDPITTDPAWWNTVAPKKGVAGFGEAEMVVDEGSNAFIRVMGGNAYDVSSVKVYLTYNTAAAADVDLKTGAVDGVASKGGLKFPLTLSWEAGEIGEKVITIPIKADKAVEGDEFFTLQLADAQGMELGEERVCVVTIHDPGYDELAAKIAADTATKTEKTAWEKLQKAKAPYIRGLADSAERGKVTGSGLCAAGKKVTLKATANNGFVFTGWCQGTGNGEQGTGMPGFDERLQKGAVEYVATTPSLVIDRSAKPAKDTATSTTITNVNEDATFYACFITSAEDKAAIAASVDGLTLDPWVSKTETHAFATNIWAGVYLEWPVAASALSATTIKVAGLPAGLKFAAKPVTAKVGSGKAAVTVTNVPANTIYGAPTAASKTKTDKKTGVTTVTPSAVKVTVTTAGKSSQTYQIDTTVLPLPAWAVGTFAGGVLGQGTGNSEQGIVEVSGQVSLTVDAKGKISGKALGDGLTYTLAAPYYSSFAAIDDGESISSNFLADVTASWSYKEGSKTIKTNDVVLLTVQDNGIGGVATGTFDPLHTLNPIPHTPDPKPYLSAWQYNWKIDPWKTLGKKFDKKTISYAILSDGSFSEDENVLTSALCADVPGRVTLKFAASGTVSVSGEFVSGAYNDKTKRYPTVKATGSATLVPVDSDHGDVFIYLTPKGLPPHARCLSVPLPTE